jgi:hypothetical protein
MGLLDDAIRDHLDLKRRHGADPGELEQAEREALGPVRRDPFEHDDEPLETSAAAAPAFDQEDEGQVFDDEYYEDPEPGQGLQEDEPFAEPLVVEHSVHEPPVPDAEEPVGEPTRMMDSAEFEEAFEEPDLPPPHPAEGTALEPPAEEAAAESPLPVESAPAAEPAPPLEPTPPAGAGAETVEYDVEEALGRERSGAAEPEAPHEGGEEDVLEETPEFLQDTPDHDRLWFEQRPPRDFDFDG